MSFLLRQLRHLPRIAEATNIYMPLAGFSWRPFSSLTAPRSGPVPTFSAARGAPARWLGQRRYAAALRGSPKECESLGPGAVVQFKRGEEYLLGIVTRANSRGWQVQDATGTLYGIRDHDVAYRLPALQSPSELAALSSEVDRLLDPSLLPLGWEVSEPGTVYCLADMASFLYGTSGPAEQAAAHCLLRSESTYFQQVARDPPMFAARSSAGVESIRTERLRAAERLAAQKAFKEAIDAARLVPVSQRPSASDWRMGKHSAFVELLEAYTGGAAGVTAASRAVSLLGTLGISPASTAAAGVLLQEIGVLPADIDLPPLLAGYTRRFEEGLELEAARLVDEPPVDPDERCRRDLTALACVTIDDPSTTEIDDALGAELLSDGRIRVWVHISDPGRWIAPRSPLAVEAARRTKSLYLPTALVPMFPSALAEGPFSLRADVPSPAFSFGFVVESDGTIDEDSIEAAPSTVRASQRLSYHEVDALFMLDSCGSNDRNSCAEETMTTTRGEKALSKQSVDSSNNTAVACLLNNLRTAASRRLAWREAQGAISFDLPEADVSVDDHRTVSIERLPAQSESPSRALVAEMMIAAGEVAARLGQKLRIALPYRGQAAPVVPTQEEFAALPEGIARSALLRSRMMRSVTEVHAPVAHAGLGLPGYVQVTSPIRRYGDLLAHWQLRAALRGDVPPFDPGQLALEMETCSGRTQDAIRLERDVEMRWVARYFAERAGEQVSATWRATVLSWLRQEAGIARVILDDLGLEAIARVQWPMTPGGKLLVTCVDADPFTGHVQLEGLEPLQE